MLPVTIFTAAVMLLLQLVFGVIVSANRGKTGIGLGDGGNEQLLKHIRVHGNFSEYVPMILIAMGLAEMAGVSAGILWTGAFALVVSRIVHAFAIHGIGGAAGIGAGAGLTYLLLGLWGLYLAAIWAGVVSV